LANNCDSVDPLASNGGPTQTIALQATSPAFDAMPRSACPATDQHPLTRSDLVSEGVCDSGAYEPQESFAGTPGTTKRECLRLSDKYRTLDAAAAALEFPSIKALQRAIKQFCGG
jgi:hypothetical protein